jgi:hypothetical protein
MGRARYCLLWAAAFTLIPIPIFWLVLWGFIALGRWIMAIRPAPAASPSAPTRVTTRLRSSPTCARST